MERPIMNKQWGAAHLFELNTGKLTKLTMTVYVNRANTKGTTINDLGGPEEIKKKNSEALLQERFGEAIARKK